MRRAVPAASLVDRTRPRPYTERLVVLREHEREPRVQELIDVLQPIFARTAGSRSVKAVV
jgi:hypothetical protein